MSTSTTKLPPITMSKLYVGNLQSEMTEPTLRKLFIDQNLAITTIMLKRGGYAFVDCPDQSSADRAIDKLNGFHFNGQPLVVEPSIASVKKSGSLTDVNSATPSVVELRNGWMRSSSSNSR